jgi:hypothetical protein
MAAGVAASGEWLRCPVQPTAVHSGRAKAEEALAAAEEYDSA